MKHPLERLKRIADETIRKQAIENFSQEYYNKEISWGSNDEGTISSAICLSFDWKKSPQEFDYWCDIEYNIRYNKLELLPEEPSELENVKHENEKLRECLRVVYNSLCTYGMHPIIDNQVNQLYKQIGKPNNY